MRRDTPLPSGAGLARCLDKALGYAGIAPEDVDYVNAHGTSTAHGAERQRDEAF